MSDAMTYWAANIPWSFRDLKEKPSYETRREMRYNLQDYMASTIPFKGYSGKSVLEIGCGAGLDSAEFARNGARVTAIDFTDTAVKETLSTFGEAKVSGTVLQMDARALVFEPRSFDLVYSFGVLHHIPEYRTALSEVRRVLKDDGHFIGMFYNKDSLLWSYSIEHLGLSIERVPGVPFAEPYSKAELQSLLSDFFREVTITTHFNVIDTPTERKVKVGVDDRFGVGWHHIVNCNK
ncbi:MAG: class I SAM-dependent methyltransferase [Nitrososphaerota archaeon]|nr:class I SAM-dependent methyltransferase [Nitrososphaerota archaeon]